MSQRIRLRDLRYYAHTGLIFGGINGLFAFGPLFIKSFSYDELAPLWEGGPLVAYWVPYLIYFPAFVALFAVFAALIALPAGYFQLRRFRRRLAEQENPQRPEAQAPQARLPRY